MRRASPVGNRSRSRLEPTLLSPLPLANTRTKRPRRLPALLLDSQAVREILQDAAEPPVAGYAPQNVFLLPPGQRFERGQEHLRGCLLDVHRHLPALGR
jgi:hypothetical protein